jgi:predicted DNA-binding transcriptional regulator AlpA
MALTRTSQDQDALLKEQEVADLLGLSVRTLQSWRIRLAGPPFVQVGRAIRYRRRDLVAWIDANTVGGLRRAAHED